MQTATHTPSFMHHRLKSILFLIATAAYSPAIAIVLHYIFTALTK